MANLKDTLVLGKLTVTDSVTANIFKGALDGTAAKATADANGANIADTYLKIANEAQLSIDKNGTYDSSSPFIGGISVNGHSISITRKTLADVGLSTVYNYKNTVTWDGLKAITSAKVGDVYSISTKDPDGNTNADWACYAAFSGHATNETKTDANYYGNYWQSLGGKVDLSGYLPKAGGDMAGTAIITWPDSGNWGNSNSGVTLPVKRGGLKWVGQSDWIELFSEESSSDMLNLVAQFGDDSSSGIKIRNHNGTDVVSLMASGTVTAKSFSGPLSGNATTSSYPLGFNSNGGNITWGTLSGDTTTTTGYRTIARWDSPNGGSVAFADGPMNDDTKKGQTSMQIDGYFYQYEGGYRVLDTRNVSGTTNYIPKFTGINTIGNSAIADNGSSITLGMATSISGLLTPTVNTNHSGIKLGDTYLTAINGNIIFQNNNAIRFGTDAWDYNQWAGLKYDHSTKTIYLGLADNTIFTANAPQSGGTIRTPGVEKINIDGGKLALSDMAIFEYNTLDKCIDVVFT